MIKISNDELGTLAYKKIKEMILAKELMPGQKIVQDKLAESLGISRTPLRTALQMLEGEYLVESVPRRGVFVKKFSDEEVVEIYDCRMALEGRATHLFTETATPEDINKLKKLFEPFTSGEINVADYQKADSEFHDTIIRGCGNNFLAKVFYQSNLLVIIDIIGLVRPPEETLSEHMKIIEAIENKDQELAESLAKSHLEKSKVLILKKIHGQ